MIRHSFEKEAVNEEKANISSRVPVNHLTVAKTLEEAKLMGRIKLINNIVHDGTLTQLI